MSNRPSPARLWQQAHDEFPDDADQRRERYLALMREHGHIVAGKQRPLPCGWKFKKDGDGG